MRSLVLLAGLLAAMLAIAAIRHLYALTRLARHSWLKQAWTLLMGVLVCAVAVAFYALVAQFNAQTVTEVEALDAAVHLLGAAFIYAMARLSLDMAHDILRSAALETAALTDALTQLPNRRQFDTVLAEQIGISRRRHQPLALMSLDIDHFKRVNDSYGHLRGDEVLERIGELLLTRKRASDTAFRVGGEEFAVLAPRTTMEEAHALAERLRLAVETSVVESNGYAIAITISVGVTILRPDDDVPSLLDRADVALYEAKRAGRNRVCIAPCEATTTLTA
ncbi:GGDEF domain-containing protein [Ancylobacter mangrovi]|uniref:GGDEF domain-containing protein n=1 Tax=Ancylobacter mangrovi TaxID=2972472 RepID=UPI002161EE6A|nr:GGDEF domain-containing protein [Ancylobacter mangrovi]MCS0501752.1 GGDEF domain-containing protein [Ancylobacter mangrovi]